MQFLGLNIPVKNVPELDKEFIPLYRFNESFLSGAKKPIGIAVERAGGEMASVNTFIYGTAEMREADRYYIDRLVKTLLWMKGGFRVYVSGSEEICSYLKEELYCDGGKQDFDFHYFSEVFEHPFEVVSTDSLLGNVDSPKKIGGHLNGCRIGFDAGGSDRKVSAVIDGETVYSEEVVWFPKLSEDPQYQYEGIVSALLEAKKHMPRVDAVGVSTAGVIIRDRVMNSSLFLKVPRERFDKEVKDIYLRAVRDCFGDIPCSVINDGDVSALAGAISFSCSNILGIAMGTSEAAGFVDKQGCITGWFNELAFVPVDASPEAMEDEWSHDIGCGVKYFSQDGVIKLAPRAGIALDANASPAEKLKAVQKLMEEGHGGAAAVYRSIGTYLAHSLAYYHSLYGFENVLLLGRVMSGKGGDLLTATCREVLSDEYPELAKQLEIRLPDEKFRRVGQSAAAASLPE